MRYVIFPLTWDLKCNTAKIMSASDTGENLNPSNETVARMSNDAVGTSAWEMAIREKWSFSSSSMKQ